MQITIKHQKRFYILEDTYSIDYSLRIEGVEKKPFVSVISRLNSPSDTLYFYYTLKFTLDLTSAEIVGKQEGFLPCQTPTYTIRLKVEGCSVKNGGCGIKSEE